MTRGRLFKGLVCAAATVFLAAPLFGQEVVTPLEPLVGVPPDPLSDPSISPVPIQGEYLTCESCAQCGGGCCGPTWYAHGEAFFLQRTRSDRIKIVEEGSESPLPPGQRQEFMTTDELDFDHEWGPRLILGRRLDACRTVELRYWGLQHWSRTADAKIPVAEADLPFVDNYTTDFDGAEEIRATYVSEMHNAECNLMSDRGWCFVPLVGFRYLNLNEEFDLAATDDGSTSDYLIETQNHLVGLQLGGAIDRNLTERLSWNFRGTVGGYVDFARQRTLLRDNGNTTVLRDHVRQQGELAFVSDLELALAYQVTPCIALTAGYQVAWVEGVALAPEQLDFTTGSDSGRGLNDDGGVFLDGGFFGIRIER